VTEPPKQTAKRYPPLVKLKESGLEINTPRSFAQRSALLSSS
jgi:hypothetical protein